MTLTIPAGMHGLPGPGGAGRPAPMRIPSAPREPELAGRTAVRVQGGTEPGPGFEPAAPDLEVVRFGTTGRARPEPDTSSLNGMRRAGGERQSHQEEEARVPPWNHGRR